MGKGAKRKRNGEMTSQRLASAARNSRAVNRAASGDASQQPLCATVGHGTETADGSVVPRQSPRLGDPVRETILPPVEEFTTCAQYRGALKLLDVTFPHSIQNPRTGKWTSVTNEEMAELYAARRRHNIARASLSLAGVGAHVPQDFYVCTYVRMYVCMYVRTQIERRSLSNLGWVGAPTSAQVNVTSALSRPEPVPSQPLLVLQVSPASAQVSNKSAPGSPFWGRLGIDLGWPPTSQPRVCQSPSMYIHM